MNPYHETSSLEQSNVLAALRDACLGRKRARHPGAMATDGH